MCKDVATQNGRQSLSHLRGRTIITSDRKAEIASKEEVKYATCFCPIKILALRFFIRSLLGQGDEFEIRFGTAAMP